MRPEEMRYCSQGEVHADFHGSTYTGLKYLKDHFGMTAVDEVLTSVARNVYRSIYERLQRGDSSELLCFWRYYLTREQCDFTLTENPDGTAELELRECPALRQLRKEHITDRELICYATDKLNQLWCENSPFTLTVEHLDSGCRQILSKKR